MNYAHWHTHFATATQGDPDVFDNVLHLCEGFGGGMLTTISNNVRSWVFCQDYCARRTRVDDNHAPSSHRSGDIDALLDLGWHHIAHASLRNLSGQLHWEVPCAGDDAKFSIEYLWGEEEFTCTAFGHTQVIANHAERRAFFQGALAQVYGEIVDALQKAPEQFG